MSTKRKKQKSGEWCEINRGPDQHALVLIADEHQALTFRYAAAVWAITERRTVNGVGEIRVRRDYGQPLYAHEHPELALAFMVAAPVMAELRKACLRAEGVAGKDTTLAWARTGRLPLPHFDATVQK